MPDQSIESLYPFVKDFPKGANLAEQAWKQGKQLLGTPLPFLGGAMTWVSDPALVSAIGQAGGFGVLASGAMPPNILSQTITETQKARVPFGVNLIVMHPQLDQMAETCIDQNVSHVVLAGGLPPKNVLQALKDAEIKVLTFAPTAALARRFAAGGIDGLIIEGNEAGGHIGPVSTSVLAQEILPLNLPIPVFVAGGIGTGQMIASYTQMGAAGCQMGTIFVCAEESCAHPKFKQAFIRAAARDATVSVQLDPGFPVIPVRGLKNKATQDFMQAQKDTIQQVQNGSLSKADGQLQIEHFWAGALRRAVQDGDIETGSLMAGQSVGLVKQTEPCKTIMARLLKETLAALEKSA